jgi:hypothetical protein
MTDAKRQFDNHHAVSKLYFTSDQLAFFDEQSAINHSMHLEDRTVTSMAREDVDKEMQEIVKDRWENELLFELLDESYAE